MNLPRIETVAVIGVGLIGGSFGMGLKKRGLAGRVIGIGRNPEHLEHALRLCAIDSFSTDLEAGVKEADLVYISTPVRTEVAFISQVSKFAKADCIITDAGSTKAEICRGADLVSRCRFVGAHPMAGSESTGVTAASSDLFVDAAYVLTPTDRTDPDALETMRALATALGARVLVMDPDTHDRSAAVISHLPHLLAATLIGLAKDRSKYDPQVMEMIAGSFRDMTRVAGSSPELWRDICLSNVSGIVEAANTFQHLLAEALHILKSGDGEMFEKWFEKSRDTREDMFKRN